MARNSKSKAKELLVHYFRLASEGGFNWDYDNQSEVEEIVDKIVDAAVEEARAELRSEIERLETRLIDLEGQMNTGPPGRDY